MSARNTTKSLAVPAPVAAQHSGLDAARHLIVTELPPDAESTVNVLLLVLESLVYEIHNPDSLFLALTRTQKRLSELGLADDETQAILKRFAEWADSLRGSNPIARLFY